MPRMDVVLHRVSNAKYVSKIDMTKGYWQVPLDKDAKRKSAFVTPFGQYQFSVMHFGMVNAGATSVRLMNEVLKGHEEYADSFFDNVGIFSDNWLFHLEHLNLFFRNLEMQN
jgi:phospholipid-translocating ATPase